MAKVFVSYSRKDITLAKRLTAELQKCELDFWIDWEGIPPTVDWWREIEKGIEESDIFLFLISPDSVQSRVCGQEIDTAVKNGKRIIPVVVRDSSWDETPAQLRHLNYIFIREGDDFDAAVKKLITAIQTDYEWAATHRRLQVKALEWERENRENSYLLRGLDLLDAEQDLATNTSKDPHPTDLQREYVFESRKATDKQRRTTTSIAIGGTIVLAVLTVVAVVMAVRATQQARVSRAGELTAISIETRDENFQLSTLLGIEAYHTLDSARTQGNLLDVVNSHPLLIGFIADQLDVVFNVAFSPDGQILALSKCRALSTEGLCIQHEILLWNRATQKTIGKPLVGQATFANHIEFSPDGKVLASGGCGKQFDDLKCSEGIMILWDVETYEMIGQPFVAHQDVVRSLAFSPDGKTIASGSRNDTIILWDLSTLTPIVKTLHGEGELTDLAFSPDGKMLAASFYFGPTILWDLEFQPPVAQPIEMDGGATSVAFSRDGKILALGMIPEDTILLWDTQKGERIGTPLTGHTKSVTSLTFSHKDQFLASSGLDQQIIVWDMETFEPKDPLLTGHSDSVRQIAFNPDDRTLVSWSDDHSFGLWDVSGLIDHTAIRRPITRSHAGFDESVLILTVSPDGKTIASVLLDGTVGLWNVDNDQKMLPITQSDTWFVNSMVFSPDGKILILKTVNTNNDCRISFWDSKTHQQSGESLQANSGCTASIAISPDGKILASGNEDGTITLWDMISHEPTKTLSGHKFGVDRIAFSPNGKLLASGSFDSLVLWDLTKRQPVIRDHKSNDDSIVGLAFSPDGKILASADVGDTIILWKLPSFDVLHRMSASINSLGLGISFSNDGKTLISTSDEGVTLWNRETGLSVNQSFAYGDAIAFTTDGTALALAQGREIMLLDMKPTSWEEVACKRAGRNFTRAEWARYFPNQDYPTNQEDATCPQWPLDIEVIPTPTP